MNVAHFLFFPFFFFNFFLSLYPFIDDSNLSLRQSQLSKLRQLLKKRFDKNDNYSVAGLRCSAVECEGFYLTNASLCVYSEEIAKSTL